MSSPESQFSDQSRPPLSPLHVIKYDEAGYGVAEYVRPTDGKTVPVHLFGTLVGEEVGCSSLVKSRKIQKAKDGVNVVIQTPSPQREKPKCYHFCLCGGCVWQHMPYHEQLKIKELMIQELFKEFSSTQFLPILGMDNGSEWHYRNKMEFSFSQDKKGNRFLGLYDRLGRGVASLKECHLVHPWMSDALEVTRSWWEESGLSAFHARKGEGTLRTLTLREGVSTGDRMVILTVSSIPEYAPSKESLHRFVEMMKEKCSPTSEGRMRQSHLTCVLRIHQAMKGVPTQLYEMILSGPDHLREELSVQVTPSKKVSLEFHISPLAFFQPNTQMAEKIYSEALLLAELKPDDIVYDLYCGTGTFGMFSAQVAKKVFAIEISKDAAYDARTNAERLGIGNFSVYCGDVSDVVHKMKEGLNQQDQEFLPPSVVIVDPPRSGLGDKAIEEILCLNPQRIVYVSCNPRNQKIDIEKIVARSSYRVKAIRPIDQFPHTPHVENIALLEREETI